MTLKKQGKLKVDISKSMFRSSPLKMLPEMSYLHRYLLIVSRNYFLDFFEDLYGRHIVRVMRFLLESLL